jgi:predicted histone-like DNA-binding protein
MSVRLYQFILFSCCIFVTQKERRRVPFHCAYLFILKFNYLIMPVLFTKTRRVNPRNPQEPGKFYPQLITAGQRMTQEKIIFQMKEKSSLSAGDIESVTTNFIETVERSLLSGFSVNFPKLGTFSLSAKATGSDTEEECTAKNIKSLHVNFRPSNSLRPNLNATRAEDKVEFVDFVTYMKGLSLKGIDLTQKGVNAGGDGMQPGGDSNPGSGDGIYIDPNA